MKARKERELARAWYIGHGEIHDELYLGMRPSSQLSASAPARGRWECIPVANMHIRLFKVKLSSADLSAVSGFFGTFGVSVTDQLRDRQQ